MIMAQNATDGKLGKLLGAATDLFDYVRQAAEDGTPIRKVEEGIWQRMLQMEREALGQFLERQGDGDLGETLTIPDGHEVKRLEEPHTRCYQSIFGEFQLQRAVYGTREGQIIEFVLLDARLQLPESEFSHVLQDWAQALGVEHAFARTAEVLRMILGLNPPVDSLERMNRKMSESVAGFRELWAVRKRYLPGKNVVEILDLLHATPRLWEAAYLFHREGSEEAALFVRNRLLRMLRGEAGYQPVKKL